MIGYVYNLLYKWRILYVLKSPLIVFDAGTHERSVIINYVNISCLYRITKMCWSKYKPWLKEINDTLPINLLKYINRIFKLNLRFPVWLNMYIINITNDVFLYVLKSPMLVFDAGTMYERSVKWWNFASKLTEIFGQRVESS